jgi:hypothetical protein
MYVWLKQIITQQALVKHENSASGPTPAIIDAVAFAITSAPGVVPPQHRHNTTWGGTFLALPESQR